MWGRKNLPGSLPANEEAAPTWHAPRPPPPIPLFLSPRRWSLQLIGGSGAHRHHTGSSSSSPRLPGRGTGHQFTMGDSSSSSAAYIKMVCVCCCTISTNGWSWLLLTSFVRALLVQVHHMIEKCICFNLSKEECMDALEKHANVKPVVTSTGTGRTTVHIYWTRARVMLSFPRSTISRLPSMHNMLQ
jgi:hypothetical protein